MSIGDEMYKWARPLHLWKFESNLDDKYNFPARWGRELKPHRRHLQDFNDCQFDGRRALREALALLEECRAPRRQEQENAVARTSAVASTVRYRGSRRRAAKRKPVEVRRSQSCQL